MGFAAYGVLGFGAFSDKEFTAQGLRVWSSLGFGLGSPLEVYQNQGSLFEGIMVYWGSRLKRHTYGNHQISRNPKPYLKPRFEKHCWQLA